MKVVAAIVLLFASTLVLGESSYGNDVDFLKWSREHLSAATREELERVYPTWRRNADYVRNHRDERFTVALNRFAHLSIDELPKTKFFATTPAEYPTLKELPADPPSEVDWVQKGDVTAVHNQGSIGCSPDFVFTDALSSLHAIKTGKLVQYSIQEVTDCCSSGGATCGIQDLVSCTKKLGGLCPAQDYPPPTHDSACQNVTCDRFSVSGLKGVPRGNEMALACAVSMEPVIATIDAGHRSFQLYVTGVYSEPECSSTKLDHQLLVVGYGKYDGEDFWLCKNSWGKSWGMNGYIMIARNHNNMCGIASAASYLV